LFFNFAFEYAIRRIRVNQDDLELNGTHRLSFHADDVNILGGRVHTIEKSTETLLVGSKVIGLGVIKLSTWSRLEIKLLEEVTI